jgi:four helix bundle protein
MSNEINENEVKKVFDLEERTARFGENIIIFAKKIPKHEITRPLISQIIRSGTSVGANYCEADCAESRKDFEHKLGICKKEAKETKHWLRMTSKAEPILIKEAKILWRESNELQLIFRSIINKSKISKKERGDF